MRSRRIVLASLALLSSASFFASAQSDRPQFRTGVELVQLDVVVLDGKRQPVSGLTAADFTVLDNGAATPIRAFTPVELARPRANQPVWANDVAPDVASNQISEEEGRLVVILMDRSIPLHEPTATARKIAAAAVASLGPHDLAAVVSTNNNAVQNLSVQNLTADRPRLLRAINAVDPSTDMSPEAATIMNLFGLQLDPLNDGRCLCGLCVPETITRVAEAVQGTPRRRKVLLFIGSDMIWQAQRPIAQISSDPGCETRLKDARNAMFAAVDRANLTVHTVDPRGLQNVAPQSQAATPNRPGASAIQTLQSNLSASVRTRENLRVLPERTGGRVVVNRNYPEQTVPEILRETDSYYVIGIERAISTRPDNARSIEVKVGRNGLRVIAQRQYVGARPGAAAASMSAPNASAPNSTAATRVGNALSGLMPSAAAPLALSLTPFAGLNGSKPIVRVNVDAGSFAAPDGQPVPLDITVFAVDGTGKPVGTARQTSTIAAARAKPSQPVEINVSSHLELSAGEYAIRVAVSDPASGVVASVFSDLTVPKFDDEPVSLSGVSVESASRTSSTFTATTRRVFKRDDHVRAVLQIYQGTARTDALQPIDMRVSILASNGASVRAQSLPFAESSFANRRADCVITLPLSALEAGEYLLKLEASGRGRSSSRALRFRVE